MRERIYAAHMASGLEGVAWEEMRARLVSVSLLKKQGGLLIFTYDGQVKGLLRLRTTEDIFAVVHYRFDLAPGRRGLGQIRDGLVKERAFDLALAAHREVHRRRVKRVTYRVVAQMRGQHGFRRVDAQVAATKAVQARYRRWKPVEEDAHLEIWLGIQDHLLVSMIRLSDKTMRHRKYKRVHIPASLRPTVAAAMVLLSKPEERDVFVDPMCGAGTILLERMLAGRASAIIGGDLDPMALAAARQNTGPYARLGVCHWDAARLPLADASVHKIVTNLPFGKRIGSPERNRALYRAFFAEVDRVLVPGGKVVLLSSARSLMDVLLSARAFASRRRVPVTVLGQPAMIYVLVRAGR